MLEETMKEQHTTTIGRRPVLKGAGMALAGLGGLTGSAVAKKGGPEQLEHSSSLTGSHIYVGQGTLFPYQFSPAVETYAQGELFDTTSADVTPNGQILHYQLQFGLDSKSYVLRHEDDGRYTSEGAVINFDLDQPNPDLGLGPGAYRATVRDDVQLYEKGGYFNWSATRVDYFSRPEMSYLYSSLILVWDEDDSGNGSPFTYRNNPGLTNPPEYSEDALGEETFTAIDAAAKALIAADVSNPGGQ